MRLSKHCVMEAKSNIVRFEKNNKMAVQKENVWIREVLHIKEERFLSFYQTVKEKIFFHPCLFMLQGFLICALSILFYHLVVISFGNILHKMCIVTTSLTCIATVCYSFAVYFRKTLDNTSVYAVFCSCFAGEFLAQCWANSSVNGFIIKPAMFLTVLSFVSIATLLFNVQPVVSVCFICLTSLIRILSCSTLLDLPQALRPFLAYLSGFCGVVAAKYIEVLFQRTNGKAKKEVQLPSIRRRRSNSTAPQSFTNRVDRRTSLPALIHKLAQPIRLLLRYVGEDFEDKHYETGPAPEYNRDSWLADKGSLGLEFPSLPYFIDGEVTVTQTNAILRYIARKHSLDGDNEAAKTRVDMIESVLTDFRNASIRLFYNPVFEKLKSGYLKELSVKLQQFDKLLGGKRFLVGDKITFVDFLMYELLDQHRVLDPGCLRNFSKLTAFMTRFEELPNIQLYMASDKFLKSPINNKNAKFSSGLEAGAEENETKENGGEKTDEKKE